MDSQAKQDLVVGDSGGHNDVEEEETLSEQSVQCLSSKNHKSLNPNAPDFTPAPPILYPQPIFSPHHIYGHMDEMLQQQQKLLWYWEARPNGLMHSGGVHHLRTPRTSSRGLGAHYIFDEKTAESYQGTPRTTLMVRNIPNKFSQIKLIKLLDEHCIQQNSKNSGSNDLDSAYDFVYLPIDFRNRCNLGYGFVNFTNVQGALRFYKAHHLKKWERFNSRKICEISYARLQGKAALEEHFLHSTFPCNTDKYLPVKFSPPRNGTQCTPPTVVASRLSGKRSFRNDFGWATVQI